MILLMMMFMMIAIMRDDDDGDIVVNDGDVYDNYDCVCQRQYMIYDTT